MPMTTRLRKADNIYEWSTTRSGRLLQLIRRDMDITDGVMRPRRRNEEVLSLAYNDGTATIEDGTDWGQIREYALNLPYRYMRWLESQMVSKKMVVKVDRNAGAGQKATLEGSEPGAPQGVGPDGQPMEAEEGPGDEETGMWVGITLQRVAYEAGFRREMKALASEVVPRGTSVIAIGYHREDLTIEDAEEVGKDPQSIAPEAMVGDTEAKDGQAHAEIAKGLGEIAANPEFQDKATRSQLGAVLARKEEHDRAAFKAEIDESPIFGARDIRHRIYMQKKRVGEDVGWAPWVYDTEDTELWWDKNLWTVAQVKKSNLFNNAFKRVVKGYDGRNVSEMMRGGETTSTESMGQDARQAQSEDILEDDERIVEWYAVWFRRPDMASGGIRKIVCPEQPQMFCEADESNPHVDDDGFALIPGFYPFYDFTPVLSSLQVPERTRGIPPMSVGMTQFERIREYNRLRGASALRHSLRLYEIHEAHKDNKELLNAIRNGEDGYAFFGKSGQTDTSGRRSDAVKPIQFTGNTQEIDRQAAREEADWVKVMAMPPAVLQGMGTAKTATQDQQGIAAGERESGAIVTYFEQRMGDVLAGIRGLMRGLYDDEDWVRLLGTKGAAVMKAWQTKSTDDGDEITVTFGANAQAQEVVERKQLMEAIQLEMSQVDPVTQLPLYDSQPLIEELHRHLGVGAPKPNDTVMLQLQQMVQALSKEVVTLRNALGEVLPSGGGTTSTPQGGPNPSEGGGPTQGNLNAGARRGTVTQSP